MLHFNQNDKVMINHISGDVMHDRMSESDDYTQDDEATIAKLDRVASTGTTSAVFTGEELDPKGVISLMQSIVLAEAKNWVPGASQRLIRRAALALELPAPPEPVSPDHGDSPGDHPLVADWTAGLYVLRCVTCERMFVS
jgi:hypothetical protein